MTATETDWLRRVADLRPWSRAGRSPHKPLLLLVYLAHLQAGGERLLSWHEVRVRLTLALEELAPSGRTNAHYPWRRLVNDSLWDIPSLDAIPETSSGDVRVGWLTEHDPAAGVPVVDWALLADSPSLVERTTRLLLATHFPPSVWSDVVDLTGVVHDLGAMVDIGLEVTSSARRRDPEFRPRVLDAWGRRCALCGYDGRRRGAPVGIDAAHLHWHTHLGPDTVDIHTG